MSFIVTIKLQLAVPQVLLAVAVTLVAPVAKVEPLAGEKLNTGAGIPDA